MKKTSTCENRLLKCLIRLSQLSQCVVARWWNLWLVFVCFHPSSIIILAPWRTKNQLFSFLAFLRYRPDMFHLGKLNSFVHPKRVIKYRQKDVIITASCSIMETKCQLRNVGSTPSRVVKFPKVKYTDSCVYWQLLTFADCDSCNHRLYGPSLFWSLFSCMCIKRKLSNVIRAKSRYVKMFTIFQLSPGSKSVYRSSPAFVNFVISVLTT